MVECPHCHLTNPRGMNFCGHCGHPLVQTDAVNRSVPSAPPDRLPAYARREPRDYTPPFLLDTVMKSRRAMVGENKRVAVLFADVVGITRIAEKLDPESLHRLMDGCFEILGDVVHGTGGTINQYTGDGIMAIFGAPIAVEDYIARACYAALEIQHRLSHYQQMAADTFGVTFQMRIGIHAGQVLVGAIGDNLRLDYSAVGDTTNLAARLQGSAAPGTIHVSMQVAEAVDRLFQFKNMGTRRLKGKSHPQLIFRLLGEKMQSEAFVRSEGLASVLVGRDRELAELRAAWKQACTDGPAAVLLTGPAGIGKTRLLTRFIDDITAQRAFVLTGSCQAYGASESLRPLMEMLASTFSSDRSTGGEPASVFRQLVQLTHRLLDRFKQVRNQAVHEDTLLERRKWTIFSQLHELFTAAAKIRPCVIAIDNCQWLDAHSIEFLASLSADAEALPLLIICAGRGADNPSTVLPFRRMVDLRPLDPAAATDLFAAALDARHLDLFLRRIAVERAGGNPLFIIELAESLRRNNQLVIDGHRVFLKSPMDQLTLPAGVYDVLAAHLDALPEAQKELLQTAAVAGASFSRRLLETVADAATDFPGTLEALENAGMIQRSPTDGDRYRFRQQMMRDVAYDMMLRRTRKEIHRKIGDALETRQRDRTGDATGQLAYHFHMAGHWAKALTYNLEAGHQARRVFACHNALVYFERAAEIVKDHHPENHGATLSKVLIWKGLMHYCVGQLNASLEDFKTLRDLARTEKNRHLIAEGSFRIGWIYFFLHKPRLAKKHLQDARQQARESGENDIYLKATSFLGSLQLVLGKFETARQLLVEALDLSQEAMGNEAKAWTLGSLIKHYNWTGEFEAALHLCEELHTLNRQLQSRYFDNFLLFQWGLIYTATGRWRKAEQMLKKGLARWKAGDELFWRPRLLNTLGWLAALQDKPRQALSLNRQALSESLESGDPETIYNARINIVENLLQLDDLEGARQEIETVWREIRHQRERYALWRFKTRARLALARLYLARGDVATASRHVRGAYQAARDTGATKHQAMALGIRSRMLRRTHPAQASRLMDQALRLAARMRTPWLVDALKAEKEGMGNSGNPAGSP